MTYAPFRPMKHAPQGFTLIETMVAVTILAVAIVGPFVAIQSVLNASAASRDQLTATLLAQEGIEYVRSTRDANYLFLVKNPGSTRSWLEGFDGSNGTANCIDPDPNVAPARNCTIDVISPPALCPASGSGTCAPLYITPSSFIYTQQATGNTLTRFTRSVTLSYLGTRDVVVKVTVSFQSGHRSYVVTLSEILSNWL